MRPRHLQLGFGGGLLALSRFQTGLRTVHLTLGHGDLFAAGAGFGQGQLRPRCLQRRQRLGHGCLGLLPLGQKNRLVQLDQHVASGDLVPLDDEQGDNAPAHLSSNGHLLGLDGAGGEQPPSLTRWPFHRARGHAARRLAPHLSHEIIPGGRVETEVGPADAYSARNKGDNNRDDTKFSFH